MFLCDTPAVTNSDNFDVSSQPNQISLVIVFDASSSSSSSTTANTFQQRQHYAELIVNQFSSRKYKLIYNYVLLPVRQNDNTERALVTSDKHELLEELNKLPKYDDRNCSACVINGILAALRNARPNSYVYTFTDGIANDSESQDEIINLIKQKQATV